MRILMVLDANDGRGMFRHGYILAKELAKIGHKVTIAYIDSKDSITEEDSIKVYRIAGFIQKFGFLYSQSNIRHHAPVPDRLIVEKLKKIIQKEQPEIIHVHGWVLYSVAFLKQYLSIPVVATLHDYGYFCPTKTLLRNNENICEGNYTLSSCLSCDRIHYGVPKGILTLYGVRKYAQLLKSSVDKYIAVSSYVKQRYVDAGFPEEHIEVIPNFYDSSEIDKVNNELNNELPGDFVLYVGEFTSFKGVNVLLKVFKNLDTNTKLVLIGRPKCPGLQSEKTLVFENPPRSLVIEAYKKCKFVVIPSIWAEPCPTVAFEAMASGKAVVASNIGGLKDIVIHGETGLLMPPGSVDSLAKAIKQLLDNFFLAKEMGQNGRKRFQDKFCIEKVTKKIEEMYKALKDK